MGWKRYWRTCPARNLKLSRRGRKGRRARRLAGKVMWRLVGRKAHAKRIVASRASSGTK